ncbi:MAG TPA: PQQ-binding-like beta-propeller repeat protein, partial [Gammaproteobacteria bacterium]|nr:PQQ-binding-like beta-propeller repeat protein [Gammaproteobacteria bacterium]
DDGHFIAREHAAGGRICAAPLVVGENVYVQSDDGTVAAYTVRHKDADKDKDADRGADPGA